MSTAMAPGSSKAPEALGHTSFWASFQEKNKKNASFAHNAQIKFWDLFHILHVYTVEIVFGVMCVVKHVVTETDYPGQLQAKLTPGGSPKPMTLRDSRHPETYTKRL